MDAWNSNVAEEGETCSVHVSRLVEILISSRCRLCPWPSLRCVFVFVKLERIFSKLIFCCSCDVLLSYSGRQNSVGHSQGIQSKGMCAVTGGSRECEGMYSKLDE